MELIKIAHNNQNIISCNVDDVTIYQSMSIAAAIYDLASKYQKHYIVWYHHNLEDEVNIDYITQTVNERLMSSYRLGDNYFSDELGYVDESLFVNINKQVKYPTWLMSSQVGVMACKTILQTNKKLWLQQCSFDFVLNSVSKTYQPLGLFCYSDPQLLKSHKMSLPTQQASASELAFFVKRHYKWVWSFIYTFNLWLYERQLKLWALLKYLFVSQYKEPKGFNLKFNDDHFNIDVSKETIDVIIPTIGRKQYLYDVLKDLNAQTHLPTNVIIVEQNPDEESESELDFLSSESWKFNIKHVFTHQTGACQARNKALQLVESKWVFLADDDIRLEKEFTQSCLVKAERLQQNVMTIACLQKNDVQSENNIRQWQTFGSGCSFMKTNFLKQIHFDEAYEFGFGEDADFGMQIRYLGYDIIYVPEPKILHLKAPVGGFRTKPVLAWDNATIQPKPSPTVMLFKLKYYTEQQLNGYKTLLFIKFYKKQSVRNPWLYYINFKAQWDMSIKWAKKIM